MRSRPCLPAAAGTACRHSGELVEREERLAIGRDHLAGLKALGVPEGCAGGCRRRSGWAWRPAPASSEMTASTIKKWQKPFDGNIHIGLSAFSDTEEK